MDSTQKCCCLHSWMLNFRRETHRKRLEKRQHYKSSPVVSHTHFVQNPVVSPAKRWVGEHDRMNKKRTTSLPQGDARIAHIAPCNKNSFFQILAKLRQWVRLCHETAGLIEQVLINTYFKSNQLHWLTNSGTGYRLKPHKKSIIKEAIKDGRGTGMATQCQATVWTCLGMGHWHCDLGDLRSHEWN